MAGMRLSSTRQIIPAVDVQASYTGLGTAQPTWRCFSTPNQVGVTALQEQHLWTYDYEPSHRPSAAYFPYLITGEPQYLDMLVEHGANLILGIPAGGSTWKVGTPIGDGSAGIGSYAGERNATISGTTYKGAGMLMRGDHIRLPAWTTRDVTQAAAIYPDVCPAGTATRLYLRDIVDSTYAAVQAYNNALPQTWRDSGLVLFGFNGTQDTEYENPWGIFYLSNSVCHQASLYPSAALVSFRQHMAKFYSGLHAISDIACITAYRMDAWKGDNTRAESSADLVFQTACTITSSVATNNLTLSDPVVTAVTNGDVFVFDSRMDADKPFAEATNNTRLHAVNTSGTTFQLALTPGGSPVTVTASVTISKVMVRLQNASPLYDFEGGNTSGASYQASMRAAIRHHEACGDTGINAARLAQDANTTQAGTVFTEEPKNAMVPAYPI